MAKAGAVSTLVLTGLVVALPLSTLAGAETTASSPTYDPRCEDVARRLLAQFEAEVAAMRQRAETFQEEQAAERAAFASQPRTAEEARAFHEAQAGEARDFYTGLWSRYQAAMHAKMDAYRAECDAYEAQAFRSWQKPEPPVPHEYRTASGEPTKAPAEPQPVYGEPARAAYPSAECAALDRELAAEMERFRAGLAAEKQSFAARQAEERQAFAREPRTEDETKAFSEAQARAAFAKHQEWQARYDAQERDVHQRYMARCAPPAGQAAEPAPACAGEVGAWEQARVEFEATQRARRAAFEAEWRERWEALQAEGADEDAMTRFKHEAAAAQLALQDGMRAAYEAWLREHPPAASCGGIVAGTRACDPERMRLEASEFERHLRERYYGAHADFAAMHAAMQAKMQAFAEELRQRRAAFEGGEPTAEDRAAFEAEEQAAWEAFQAAMETERQAHAARMASMKEDIEARLRAEMERFLKEQSARCWSGASPAQAEPPATRPARDAKVVEAYRTIDHERRDCVLEVRLRLHDFGAQQLRDLQGFLASKPSAEAMERFEGAQPAALEAFDAQLREMRAACEDKFREDHRAATAEAHEGAEPWERMGSFRAEMDEAAGEVHVQGAHVAFTGDRATEAIYSYAVGGQLFLDAIRKEGRFTDFRIEDGQHGSVMTIVGEGLLFRFHDNPNGLVNIRVREGTVELDLADYLEATVTAKGIELRDGGRRAVLLGDALKLDGDTVLVRGEANFLVDGEKQAVLDKVANRHRGDIAKAVEAKRVAAEVTVVMGEDGLAAERLTYEDLTIEVERPRAAGMVSVRIDNPEHEGRTVVLNLDKGLLGDLAGVTVKVFEVEDAGERDASAAKASSLADVLDPSDDQGPEYWVVVDEDGVQVLVSFAHFSEKRVEVQGGGSEVVPRLVPGPGLLGLLGAAALALARRRQR